MLCNLVYKYQHFGRTFWLLLQGRRRREFSTELWCYLQKYTVLHSRSKVKVVLVHATKPFAEVIEVYLL
jgi:hypothetical protein